MGWTVMDALFMPVNISFFCTFKGFHIIAQVLLLARWHSHEVSWCFLYAKRSHINHEKSVWFQKIQKHATIIKHITIVSKSFETLKNTWFISFCKCRIIGVLSTDFWLIAKPNSTQQHFSIMFWDFINLVISVKLHWLKNNERELGWKYFNSFCILGWIELWAIEKESEPELLTYRIKK